MKKVIFASAVLAAAISAPVAADSKSTAYSACKNEIRSELGEDTIVSLRKIRGRGDDLRVTVRVSQPGVDAMTVTCLYNDGELAFESRDKKPLELAALNGSSSETAIN